ncbi:MAG TPA: bifunctional nuclease family protein [Thermomicrobiales bacterium]|nr:bifunctional nuclease family protein [Thermomicrobiales bacterium]
MIETTVESIRVSLVTQNRVVILKESDGNRHLPIWIGAYEAEAIAMELQGVVATRPLPYDLMRAMLGELGARVDHVIISDLNDQVFFARIVLDVNGRTVELDSRPSDAIALAVRAGSRILVADAIMDQVGVSMDGDEDDDAGITAAFEETRPDAPIDLANLADTGEPRTKAEEDRLGVFRDFINSLDLDDFDKKR